MSDEPETKRAKIDAEGDNDAAKIALGREVEQHLEGLDKVQLELNEVNDKASAEIIEIEQKYNVIRQPFFEKRHKFIEGIPNFWCTVFINHPATRALLSEDEEECFHYCTKVDIVEEYKDNKDNCSIKFFFDVNPFFENTELVKQFSLPTSGEADATCTATKIEWKPEKKLGTDAPPQDISAAGTFFDWFLDTSDPSNDEIADIIKDDIWLNPLQYYLLPEDASGYSDSGGDIDSSDDDQSDGDINGGE